jgi:TM2 domain-containing membrane protein YozV
MERITVMGTGISSGMGRLIAAIASAFIPGLGQLLQGRIFTAILLFLVAAVAWVFMLGWLIHLLAALEAFFWKGR